MIYEPKNGNGKINNLVFNVVAGLLLLGTAGFTMETARTVNEHAKLIASLTAKVEMDSSRIASIEDKGSRSLEAHVTSDDARVIDIKARIDKLETAVLLLEATPGDLKAIKVQLDNLKETLNRIERQVGADHIGKTN